MNVQLDFSTKVIRLNSTENFLELYKKLKKLLPDLKDWKLDSAPITHWYNPIIWDWNRPYYWYNPYPLFGTVTTTPNINGVATCGSGGDVTCANPPSTLTTTNQAQGFYGNVQDCNSIVNLQLN